MAEISLKLKTEHIIKVLEYNHPPSEWASFVELRHGNGLKEENAQRFDYWAINYFPSKQNEVRCYEIKSSRADFFNEINKPLKRRAGLRLSNTFYFVTPKGLVKIEEVPTECGLIEVADDGTMEKIIPAPFRNTIPPTWSFLSSICRRFDKDRLEKFKYEQKNAKLLKEIQSQALATLDTHIEKWKNYSLGNKEVPDIIAKELESIRFEILNSISVNKNIL